ncbi:hypothetical protein LTR49_027919 [Elasticomyces elasticus]|nr:hypothetical protein LTR49_027919 [Elasticomyces elasticus]
MVKRLSRQGGGYVVLSEGIHHLHCLNLLRQASYFNYEYYRELGKGAFVNTDVVVETHLGHCLDILRQQLMCTFDTSVFGQWWVKDVGPFVDFNTKHRCKNFDAFHEWVRAHELSGGDLVEFQEGDDLLPEVP